MTIKTILVLFKITISIKILNNDNINYMNNINKITLIIF